MPNKTIIHETKARDLAELQKRQLAAIAQLVDAHKGAGQRLGIQAELEQAIAWIVFANSSVTDEKEKREMASELLKIAGRDLLGRLQVQLQQLDESRQILRALKATHQA